MASVSSDFNELWIYTITELVQKCLPPVSSTVVKSSGDGIRQEGVSKGPTAVLNIPKQAILGQNKVGTKTW